MVGTIIIRGFVRRREIHLLQAAVLDRGGIGGRGGRFGVSIILNAIPLLLHEISLIEELLRPI